MTRIHTWALPLLIASFQLLSVGALSLENPEVRITIENPIDEDEPDEIHRFLSSTLSESNEESYVENAKDALEGLERFSSIECTQPNADKNQKQLSCHLKRFPIIRNIGFEDVPLLVLEKDLKKHIPIKISDVIDPESVRFNDLIKRSETAITSYLNKQGFFHSRVSTSYRDVFGAPAKDILFKVEGGSFVRVHEVTLKGEVPFDPEIVLKPFRQMCASIRYSFEGVFQGTKACFNKEVEQQTIATVEERLADLGYVESHVSVEKVFIDRGDADPNLVDLRISVRPLGPKLLVTYNYVDAQVLDASVFARFFRGIFGVEIFSRIFNTPSPGAKYLEDQSIIQQHLEDAITFRDAHTVDDNQMNASVAAIKEALRERGYFNAKVDFTTETLRGNWIRVNFKIDPGTPTSLSSIKLSGIDQFAYSNVSAQLPLNVSARSLFSSGHFTNASLEKDTNLIREFLVSQGFAEAKVKAVLEQSTHGLELTYYVEPGPVRRVSRFIFVNDDHAVTKTFFEQFKQCIHPDLSEGSYSTVVTCDPFPFNESVAETDRLKLIQHYERNAYLGADPKYSFDQVGELITIRYDFSSKKLRKARIAELIIDGNVATRRNVIERELGLKNIAQGAEFNPVALDEGLGRLRSYGVFSKLSLDPLPKVTDSNDYFLYLQVAEKPTFTVDMTLTYDSDFLFDIGVFMHERNLFGALLQLETDLNFGLFIGRRSSFRNRLSWPHFFGAPMEIEIKIPELLYEILEAEVIPERHARFETSIGVEWLFLQFLRPQIEFSIRADKWQLAISETGFVEDTLSLITSLDGLADVLRQPSTSRLVLKPGVSFLSLDDLFNPRFGYKIAAGLELSGATFGNEIGFNVLNLDSTGYYSLGPVTLAATLHLQRALIDDARRNWWVLKHQSDFETLGGVQGPRAYAKNEIGIWGLLLDNRGNQIGPGPVFKEGYHTGNFMLQSSLELRFPLVDKLLFGKLNGAIFSDFGFIGICDDNFFCFNRVGGVNPEGKNQQMGIAVGVGLRYLLPIGPLTVDYGISPIDTSQSRINFQFGYPF